MRLKLFPKIALILVFLAILPVVIVGLQTATLNKDHLESNILELHTNLANSLSNRVDLYLESLAAKVRSFIETMRAQEVLSAGPFQVFLDSNKEFVSISYLNPKGKELIKAVNISLPHDLQLRDRTGESIYQSYSFENEDKEILTPLFEFFVHERDPRLAFIFPYDPQDNSRGAFYITVSLASLWRDIIQEGSGVGGGGREALIVNEEGFMIAHSHSSMMSRIFEKGSKGISVEEVPIVKEALRKKTIGSREYKDKDGNSMIGSYANIKWTGWVSIIQQPKETAYYAVRETRKRAFQIILLSISVAALIAFILAKNISRPIFSLIEGARKIARGEFDHTVQIKQGDEMGDLAATFNEMTRELKRYSELQVDRIIEEKTKTESVIFSIADGIILTDRNGQIQLINEHAVEIFSLKKEDYLGKNLIDLIHDSNVKDVLQEFLANPEASRMKEVTLWGQSFEQHYQLSSEPVYTHRTGKNVGVVTVVHDVTLERQMDQLKESFLHSITHDLRNPMTSIQGFTKFLMDEKSGPINESQKKMLTTMERAEERLLGMINDILDAAKFEAGKLEVRLDPFRIDLLVQDVKMLYTPLTDKKMVKLETILPNGGEDEVTILGDTNQIERVIGNLMANAVKYTPFRGNISISLEDLDDRVQITVSDNGPGIPESYREKVFDKFQQVKGEKRGGTGLGLTICKYFVELHKGKIWVESQVGRGSRFVFWIPKNLKRAEGGGVVRHYEIS